MHVWAIRRVRRETTQQQYRTQNVPYTEGERIIGLFLLVLSRFRVVGDWWRISNGQLALAFPSLPLVLVVSPIRLNSTRIKYSPVESHTVIVFQGDTLPP